MLLLIIMLLLTKSYAQVLRVGVSPDYYPMSFRDGGKLSGFEIDLVTEIAEFANLRLEFVESSFDLLVPMMLNGQVDVIIASITKDSSFDSIAMSSIPYLVTDIVVIDNASGSEDVTAVQLGSSFTKFATEQIRYYSDAETMIHEVLKGNVSRAIIDSIVMMEQTLAPEISLKVIAKNEIVALSRDSNIIKLINDSIVNISDKIEKLKQKWIKPIASLK